MKKRLAIFGGEMFETLKYESREYVPLFNRVVNELKMNYEVYNFALGNKNINFHAKLIENFLEQNNFSTVILGLGEYEVNKDLVTIQEFTKRFRAILTYLATKKVEVIVYLLEGNSLNVKRINKEILDIVVDFEVKVAGLKKNGSNIQARFTKLTLQCI